jgi:hypothetical protein
VRANNDTLGGGVLCYGESGGSGNPFSLGLMIIELLPCSEKEDLQRLRE